MNSLARSRTLTTTPTDVVQTYLAAFGGGDIDAALALMAEDVAWHVDGNVNVSTVGLLRGRAQVHQWLESFPRNFEPRLVAIDKLIEEDGEVVAFGRFRHAVLSTNRTVGSDFMMRFSVRNGQIARYQIFEDSALLARSFDAAERWDRQEARVNGMVYAYSDRGEGPVTLFAHGLFVDRTAFDAQVAALAGTHRCIALDMPGHGESGHRPSGWTLDALADDLALMIEELSLGTVVFVGESQGGMVGIRLAARWPKLVSRLVLVGTSARAEDARRLDDWRALRHTLLHGSDIEREAAAARVQQRAHNSAWLEREVDAAARQRAIMLSHDRTGVTLALAAATIEREDVRGLLKDIAAPTLVICGGGDRATPIALSEEIAFGINGARIKVLAGVGHHSQLEAPQEVSFAIADFLK